LALRQFDAAVERGGQTAVGLEKQPQARVAILFEYLLAGIRRAVINDNQFELLESLGKDAVQRFAQVVRAMITLTVGWVILHSGWDEQRHAR
jgi:hypothetical protein